MAGYYPTTMGAQQTSRYPRVGPNYQKYGEQPGWKYDYSIDMYRRDPKVDQEIGLAEKPKSTTDQLMPIAAVAGGTALATEAGKQALPMIKEGVGAAYTGAKGLLGFGDAAGAATTATESALPSALQTGASSSAVPVGTAANGGTLMSDGTIAGSESMLGSAAPYLGAAGAALGAKGIYDATQLKNRKSGAISGGISGAGMGLGAAAAMAPLLALGPAGWAAMALGGGALGAGMGGVMARESTDDKSKRRFGTLEGMAEDAAWKDIVNTGRQESVDDRDTWDLGDDTSDAPIDLMTRSYGVLNTFGPEWAGVDPAKRQEVVSRMVGEGLINSKQGDYLVENQDRAKEIYNEVVGTPQQAPIVRQASGSADPMIQEIIKGKGARKLPGEITQEQLKRLGGGNGLLGLQGLVRA